MKRITTQLALTTTAAAAVLAAASTAQAGLILADDFSDVALDTGAKTAAAGTPKSA